MKKLLSTLFVFALALVAPMSYAQDVLSQSVSDGVMQKTRTLDSTGKLTESVCVALAVTPETVHQHCTSKVQKLSASKARQVANAMQAEAQFYETAARSLTRSDVSRSQEQGYSMSQQMSSGASKSVSYK